MKPKAKNVSKSLQKSYFMVDQITPRQRLNQLTVRYRWLWQLVRFLNQPASL